jgi:hypothetical protein
MKITKNAKKVTASKEVVANKNYQAAQRYIKCAIDALGACGKSDEFAKDRIADLSVVLFDINASTDCESCGDIKASTLTEEQKAKVWEIANSYTTSDPKSGDWDTETKAEQKEIAKALEITLAEAKQIMIDELGFEENQF